MTKPLPPASIENAIRAALRILGDAGAEEAIETELGLRRSASLLRKCADPDCSQHQLQLRYALALDIACARRGHPAPITRAMAARLACSLREPGPAAPPEDIEGDAVDTLLRLQAMLGDLARQVLAAKEAATSPCRDPAPLARFAGRLAEMGGEMSRLGSRLEGASGRAAAGLSKVGLHSAQCRDAPESVRQLDKGMRPRDGQDPPKHRLPGGRGGTTP